MHRTSTAVTASAFLVLSCFAVFTPAKGGKPGGAKLDPKNAAPVLWRDPGDISSRNLFYGPGGKEHEPKGVFTFEKEDKNGTNPKFDVVDSEGVRWGVKMGPEAGPETVATRLVWGVGYFANEEYFMPVLRVDKMQHLHRGKSMVQGDTVMKVRLKRHCSDQKKAGDWSWSKNPFTGKREWYGLRVLMAVMNNWDLKDMNNSIYLTPDAEARYVVSDLGASFGTTGLNWMLKGDPASYCESKLIRGTTAEDVDFIVPSAPALNYYINFPEMARRMSLTWLGRNIPRADARWMGDLLGRLSHEQIRDAFRAGGYSPQDIDRMSQVLERRIAELKAL